MAEREHRARRVESVTCAVITVSDSRTVETDASGTLMRERLETQGHQVCAYEIIPDEPANVRDRVLALCDDAAIQAVLVTGGTGLAPRDTTFEAISEILDKQLAGFGELFRSLLAFLVFALRDRERAAVLYELLLPYAELSISHDLMRCVAGSAESVLGLLAALLDRNDEAIAHLERALEKELAMGARPALLRTRLGLAAALRTRAAPGDSQRAAALEREAKREAEALGCRLLAEVGQIPL